MNAQDRELLSAHHDGETTPAERERVQTLLRTDPEARALLASFGVIRATFADLKLEPAPSIKAGVLCRLSTVSPNRTARRLPTWLPAAVAASLFLLLGGAALVFFNQPKPDVAIKRMPGKNNVAAQLRPVETAVEEPATVVAKNDKPVAPRIEILPVPQAVQGNGDILAAPTGIEFELSRAVTNRVSIILPFKDLDQAYPAQKVREEIARDEIVRIDLFTKDLPKAHEQMLAALKGRGLAQHQDALLADKLKRKAPTGDILYFSESLTAAELADLLQNLSKQDKARAARQKDEGLFDRIVLIPHQPYDTDRLARSMGVPGAALKLPRKHSPVIDSKLPLDQGTATKLANGFKKPDAQFLAVPYYAAEKGASVLGRETKTFLDARGEVKKDAKAVIVVVRGL